jgi:hypothetical protein
MAAAYDDNGDTEKSQPKATDGRPEIQLTAGLRIEIVQYISDGYSRASACAARKIDPKTLKKLMTENPDFEAEVRVAETIRDQCGERTIFSLMKSENEAIRIRAAIAYQARVDNTKKAREAKREKAKAAQLEQEKAQPAPAPAQSQIFPEEIEVIRSMRLGNRVTILNDRVGVTQTYQRTDDFSSPDVVTYQCDSVPTDGDERGRHFLDLDRPPRIP